MRIFTCLFLLITSVSLAQNNLIGAGISYTDDLYVLDDVHGAIRAVRLPSPEVAIYWRKSFKSKFLTQLGVSIKPYWEGLTYVGASWYSGSLAFTAVKLNADVGYSLRLTKRLSIVPRMGVSSAINTSTYIGSGGVIETIHANGAVVRSTYQESPDVNRVFLLGHGTIGVECDFFRSFVLGMHLGYHVGFMKSNVLHVQYTIDQSPTYYATQTSRGQYLYVGIGIGYKVGVR